MAISSLIVAHLYSVVLEHSVATAPVSISRRRDEQCGEGISMSGNVNVKINYERCLKMATSETKS